jgi:hypothetical protein
MSGALFLLPTSGALQKDGTMKPAFWIIKSDRFDSVLATNGRFYNLVSVNRIKTYKREHNATRKLFTLPPGRFTAYAVYAGDTIDCCGRITKEKTECPQSSPECNRIDYTRKLQCSQTRTYQ